jgi:hypothetical protein
MQPKVTRAALNVRRANWRRWRPLCPIGRESWSPRPHNANAVPNRSRSTTDHQARAFQIAEICQDSREERLRLKCRQSLKECGVCPLADAQRTLAPEAPVDSFGLNETRDVLAEVTFEGGFPGHKAEAEAILDHRKSARWQTEALTVDTGDRLARLKRSVLKAAFDCDIRCSGLKVALAKGIDELPGEDDPLAIAAGQSFGGKVIDAALRRLSDVVPEADVRHLRPLSGDQLPVKPGGTWRCDLGFYRQIRACRDSGRLSVADIRSSNLDDSASRRREFRRFGVAKANMVSAAVNAVDNRIRLSG